MHARRDEAPDYMKLKLLGIAQQWYRLAEFAAEGEAEQATSDDASAAFRKSPGGSELGA